MSDKTLVSNDNAISILTSIIQDLKTKINNKDVSLPYITLISKSSFIKVDGLGDMFLNNNGAYINIGNVTKSSLDIDKIYEILITDKTQYSWDNTTITNINKSSFGCVEYNGKIYCLGGVYASGWLNTVNIYDLSTNTWSAGTNMVGAAGKNNFGCAEYNGKIYCIAGLDSASNLATNDVYDIASNTWSTKANIGSVRTAIGCAEYNDKIYCIGGYNNINAVYLNAVSIYNTTTNVWTSGTNMPTLRQSVGCVQYNGKIYCIGGYSGTYLNKVEIYDIASNTWSTGANLLTAESGAGLEIYKDNIYCIGGYNTTNSYLTTVQVYNIPTNTWGTIIDLPKKNASFGCVYIDKKIYCIGGPYNYTYMSILTCAVTGQNISLPLQYQDKLNKIMTNGAGTKVLSNDSTYKTITPSYATMDSTQITNGLNTILS